MVRLCSDRMFTDIITNMVIYPIVNKDFTGFELEFMSGLSIHQLRKILISMESATSAINTFNYKDAFTGRHFMDSLLVQWPLFNTTPWPINGVPDAYHFINNVKTMRMNMDQSKVKLKIPEMFKEESDNNSILKILELDKIFGRNCPGHCPYFNLFHSHPDRELVEEERHKSYPKSCRFHQQSVQCYFCEASIACFNDAVNGCEYCFNPSWKEARAEYYKICRGEDDPEVEFTCEDYATEFTIMCKKCYVKARLTSRYRKDCMYCFSSLLITKGKPTKEAIQAHNKMLFFIKQQPTVDTSN